MSKGCYTEYVIDFLSKLPFKSLCMQVCNSCGQGAKFGYHFSIYGIPIDAVYCSNMVEKLRLPIILSFCPKKFQPMHIRAKAFQPLTLSI